MFWVAKTSPYVMAWNSEVNLWCPSSQQIGIDIVRWVNILHQPKCWSFEPGRSAGCRPHIQAESRWPPCERSVTRLPNARVGAKPMSQQIMNERSGVIRLGQVLSISLFTYIALLF